jgi:hypothetical protein
VAEADDITAAALLPLRASEQPGSGYTRVDRYRDFHAVFASDAGKRVLRQIVDHCEGRVLPQDDANLQQLAAYVARRKVGLWIVATASVPPPRQSDG